MPPAELETAYGFGELTCRVVVLAAIALGFMKISTPGSAREEAW
jgi:hypothetical protein